MIVRITSMNLQCASDIPNVETLADFDVVLRDEIHVQRCVLVRSSRGLYVYPPKGNRKGRVPVKWNPDGELATAIIAAAGSMFEQMSGVEV